MKDHKKSNASQSTITRDKIDIANRTGNIYESISIMTKRSNQISMEMREELLAKLEEFATTNDNLEEIFENKEQIEVSKFYERLPKPTLIAIQEFLENNTYYRNPAKEPIEDEEVI